MSSQRFVKIGKKHVPVTEEVYFAFKRPAWAERKRRKHRVEVERSLEQFLEDGFDVPDGQSVEDIVTTRMLVEKLYVAISRLSESELVLVTALYFDGYSERNWSEITGIPQKTINDRKHRVLAKLKKLMHE